MRKMAIVITFLCLLYLTGCSCAENSYITHENGLNITIDDEWKEHFLYPEPLPVKRFEFPGVNVSKASKPSMYVFVRNDQYALSQAWAAHLAGYNSDQKIIIASIDQTSDEKVARFGKDQLPLDEFDENQNLQKYSKEERMVAWSADGTRYSYKYRTFVSGNIRYYIYCYTENLTIAMEQSVMVLGINTTGANQNKLVLLPLPFDTKYQVSTSSLTVDALIRKNTYLDETYYCFLYPESLANRTNPEKIAAVTLWYQTYCHGVTIGDEFIIQYAGAKFKVDFTKEKVNPTTNQKEAAFQLSYWGKA